MTILESRFYMFWKVGAGLGTVKMNGRLDRVILFTQDLEKNTGMGPFQGIR
jgi:hypothetical protein